MQFRINHEGRTLIYKRLLSNGWVSLRCTKHSHSRCGANFKIRLSDINNNSIQSLTQITPHSCPQPSENALAESENSQTNPPQSQENMVSSSPNNNNSSQISNFIPEDTSEIESFIAPNQQEILNYQSTIHNAYNNIEQVSILRNPSAKTLMINYLTNPISFHISKFREKGYLYSENAIKWALQSLRSHYYPVDREFLKNPFEFLINLNPTIVSSNSFPFCISEMKFYNFRLKRTEHYMILSTSFQLKIFSETKQLFIDGTFQSCPKTFYQILIIHGTDPITKLKIPIMFILMSSRSTEIYESVFFQLKYIIFSYNLPINVYKFHADFEKALVNSFKKSFANSVFVGDFFHFVKALWRYVADNGLKKRDLYSINMKLINILKTLPFIEKL